MRQPPRTHILMCKQLLQPTRPPFPAPFRAAVTISGSKHRYFILPAAPAVPQDQSLQPGMLALPAALLYRRKHPQLQGMSFLRNSV